MAATFEALLQEARCSRRGHSASSRLIARIGRFAHSSVRPSTLQLVSPAAGVGLAEQELPSYDRRQAKGSRTIQTNNLQRTLPSLRSQEARSRLAAPRSHGVLIEATLQWGWDQRSRQALDPEIRPEHPVTFIPNHSSLAAAFARALEVEVPHGPKKFSNDVCSEQSALPRPAPWRPRKARQQ